MKLSVQPVRLELRRPLKTAWGELSERELLHVQVIDRDGLTGHGEAAPLEPYDGIGMPAVRAALDAYAAVLAAAPPGAGPEELVALCAAERPLAPALAAIDLALWDLEGRRARLPVHALLHPRATGSVEVNATIAADDPEVAAADAGAAAERGFRTVKVKVGVGDDIARVAAVRAAVGRAVEIRLDANGAWQTPADALTRLIALAPNGIEMAEEPVHGVELLRALRLASPVPIAMDETAAEEGAAGSGATDAVCLKIARCGGIGGVLAQAAAARAAGSDVYLASSYDGPIGIAAALHAAAVLAVDAPLLPCGLATLDAFATLHDPIPVVGGVMTVPSGPGLL